MSVQELKSYFFLWCHSFSCRWGIAIFPGGHQIWFINLWIHEVNPEPFKGSLQRALSKTPWFKMDSTILWSCDTCPPGVSLSHLMRSVATGPRAALCDRLLCCAAVYVESLARYDFKEWVRQVPPEDQVHPELLQSPGLEFWSGAIQTLAVVYSK